MIELLFTIVLFSASECTPFSLDDTIAVEANGEWFITDGETRLSEFGKNQSQAERSLEVIKHYGMNERCNAGSSDLGLQYWLVNGESPSGALEGETCFSFHPDRIKIKQVDESWKIVESRDQILNFRSEQTAQAAYNAIRTYRFSHCCFVGRPEPKFLYLRH